MDEAANRWSIHVENYRGIRAASWSGSGVNLIVGPNGAGKTSLLRSLALMRSVYLRGVQKTFNYFGGPSGQRHIKAPPEAPIVLEITWRNARWRLEVPVHNGVIDNAAGELFEINGDPLFTRALGASAMQVAGEGDRHVFGDACCLRQFYDRERSPALEPFITAIQGVRIYEEYDQAQIHTTRPEDAGHDYLHPTGRDLLHVLSRWRAAPMRYGHRFDWVMRCARDLFPDLMDGMDLHTIGTSVEGRFYPSDAGPDDSIPLQFAADGLKTGLLHLTALAGAEPETLLVIDEVENYLHPYAIRALVGVMRRRAAEQGLTILLTTHSPVLLNAFSAEPQRVHVIEASEDGLKPLSDLKDPNWLIHFELGDLFERQKFGAPPVRPTLEDREE